MASPAVCLNSGIDGQCPRLLNTLKTASQEQQQLMHELKTETLEIRQSGTVVKKKLGDANDKYISVYYPKMEMNFNCWPIVYKMKDYEIATHEMSERANESEEMQQKYGYRRGNNAEDRVIKMFVTMFRDNCIPSFIISTYEWFKTFCKELPSTSREKLLELFPGEGEIDLIISIPGECILLVEVKAARKRKDVKKVVKKGLNVQCPKSLDFLSIVLADDSNGCNIPVISVVALPNANRDTAKYCEHCLPHIATHNDLNDIQSLNSWYEKLRTKYSDQISKSQFSVPIFKKLIGWLVGPCSIKQFETVPGAISETVCSIDNVCYELNPGQVYSHCQLGEQFVWIRGVPGSGKTILGCSKANDIINCDRQTVHGQHTEDSSMSHVLYIIIESNFLRQEYAKKFQAGSASCKVFVGMSLGNTEKALPGIIDGIPNLPILIKGLQNNHKGEVVHIIIEECRMKLKDVDRHDFTTNWRQSVNEDRLGNVWIIQSSYAAEEDSTDDPLPNFKIIDLRYIMRMSVRNIDFLNIVLDKTYKSGHAVPGKCPIVYRMSCICGTGNNDNYHCSSCYRMRILWMLRKAISDLKVDTSMAVCKENAFITSSFTKKQLEEFGIYYDSAYSVQSFNERSSTRFPSLYFASSIHHFAGCENSHMFVEFRNVVHGGFSAMESLSRAVGQMVLLDGGCCSEDDIDTYKTLRTKVDTAKNEGIAELTVMEECVINKAKEAFSGYALVTTAQFGKEEKEKENENLRDEKIIQDVQDNNAVPEGNMEKRIAVLQRDINERINAVDERISKVERNVFYLCFFSIIVLVVANYFRRV